MHQLGRGPRGEYRLIFHHFSNFDPLRPDLIAQRNPEQVATFAARPDLKPLYDDYAKRLLAAGYEAVHGLACCYGRRDSVSLAMKLRGAVQRTLEALPRVARS